MDTCSGDIDQLLQQDDKVVNYNINICSYGVSVDGYSPPNRPSDDEIEQKAKELDAELRHLAVDWILHCGLVPLKDFEEKAETDPGFYVILYSGEHELYKTASVARGRNPTLRSGGTPLYSGSARDLKSRLRAHKKSVDSAKDLDLNDFFYAAVTIPSHNLARNLEHMITDELKPVWNNPHPRKGFGANHQGKHRKGQKRRSHWDTAHLGRRTAVGGIRRSTERVKLRKQAREHVESARTVKDVEKELLKKKDELSDPK